MNAYNVQLTNIWTNKANALKSVIMGATKNLLEDNVVNAMIKIALYASILHFANYANTNILRV